MLHALSWCHGQLQDDKSVLKAVSLKLWTDGTKNCKTGLFLFFWKNFCFFLFSILFSIFLLYLFPSSKHNCQTKPIPQRNNFNHRQKKDINLNHWTFLEFCFINILQTQVLRCVINKRKLFPQRSLQPYSNPESSCYLLAPVWNAEPSMIYQI